MMHKRLYTTSALCGMALILGLGTSMAHAKPEGGQVVVGSASISEASNTLNIHQHTDKTIIDWRSFDIAPGEHTQFHQPSSDATALNRVNSHDPSQIMGALTANGNVILVNPAGIFFGADSRVDVGGLIASTADIDNQDFIHGNLDFKYPGHSDAQIMNHGNITAKEAGLVGLVAPHVENHGIITAKMGRIALATGDAATVDLYGDGLMEVRISDAVEQQILKNRGTLDAESGTIALTSAESRGLVNSLISVDGAVSASSIHREGGTITIGGTESIVGLGGIISADGTEGGHINVTAQELYLAENISAEGSASKGGAINLHTTGRTIETSTSHINASGHSEGGTIRHTAGSLLTSGTYAANSTGGKGGNLDVSATTLASMSASFNANGSTEGGQVRIGGEFQGGKHLATDELPNAQNISLSSGTEITAQGTSLFAQGGTAIVWSDNQTTADGTVNVSGGIFGSGGFVELSSSENLYYRANVTTGLGGTLLLDPKNITIGSAGPSTLDAAYSIIGVDHAALPSLKVSGPVSGDNFGNRISLDGNRLAIGAYFDDGFGDARSNSGAVYLVSFTDSSFNGGTLEAIVGDGYTGGKNINLTLGTSDFFGTGVSIDGNRLAVGAQGGDGSGNALSNSGDVYLFSFTDSTFSGGTLEAMVGENYVGGKNVDVSLSFADRFGWSLSLDGNRLAVGAYTGDTGTGAPADSGEVYLFSFTDSVFSGGNLEAAIGHGWTGGKNIDIAPLDGSDRFGSSVSLDGTRLAVGLRSAAGFGNGLASSGEVYLFSFTDSVFSGGVLEAIIGDSYVGGKNIDPGQLDGSDFFGYSVSLDGNRVAVGARDGDGFTGGTEEGEIYLFSFTDSVFSGGTLEAIIGEGYVGGKNIDLTQELTGTNAFGSGIALDGTRLAVGNESGNSGGEIYLFSFTDSVFSGGNLERIVGGDPRFSEQNINFSNIEGSDNFGESVSLDGNRLAVGAPGGDGFGNAVGGSGEVYLFSFTDSDFNGGTLEATIGDGYVGGKNIDLSQLEANDNFGESVSLDGNRLAVGTNEGDGSGNGVLGSGEVYLFSFTDSDFNGGTLEATIGDGYVGGKNIDLSQLDINDSFGESVSLNGNRLVVGAPEAAGSGNAENQSGDVYLFSFTDSTFSGGTLEGTIGNAYVGGKNIDVSQVDNSDRFGADVSLDGDRLAVGARSGGGSGDAVANSGEVYLFSFTDSAFSGGTLEATVGDGYVGGKNVDITLGVSDQFGSALALEDTRLVVGAPTADGSGNIRSASGDVYVFDFTDTNFTGGSLSYTLGFNYTGAQDVDMAFLDTFDEFGRGISIDSNRMVIGAPEGDGKNNTVGESGEVYLFKEGIPTSGDAVTDGDVYTDNPASNLTITAYDITTLLDAGTDVILQASNDITVDQVVTADNSSGDGGDFELNAGRSILINSNITSDNGNVTLIANDTLANGVVDAQRDAGNAEITMAAGTSINAGTGTVTVELRDGAGKTNTGAGDISLRDVTADTINVTSQTGAITSAAGTFTATNVNLDAQTTMAADLNATNVDINNNATGATLTGLVGGSADQTAADMILGGPGNDANYTFEGFTIRLASSSGGGGGGSSSSSGGGSSSGGSTPPPSGGSSSSSGGGSSSGGVDQILNLPGGENIIANSPFTPEQINQVVNDNGGIIDGDVILTITQGNNDGVPPTVEINSQDPILETPPPAAPSISSVSATQKTVIQQQPEKLFTIHPKLKAFFGVE